MLVPRFKCQTNPYDITKHYWSVSDIFSEFPRGSNGSSLPFPCFYKKGCRYYYAGEYVAFEMDNLSQQEWSGLGGDVSYSKSSTKELGGSNLLSDCSSRHCSYD